MFWMGHNMGYNFTFGNFLDPDQSVDWWWMISATRKIDQTGSFKFWDLLFTNIPFTMPHLILLLVCVILVLEPGDEKRCLMTCTRLSFRSAFLEAQGGGRVRTVRAFHGCCCKSWDFTIVKSLTYGPTCSLWIENS